MSEKEDGPLCHALEFDRKNVLNIFQELYYILTYVDRINRNQSYLSHLTVSHGNLALLPEPVKMSDKGTKSPPWMAFYAYIDSINWKLIIKPIPCVCWYEWAFFRHLTELGSSNRSEIQLLEIPHRDQSPSPLMKIGDLHPLRYPDSRPVFSSYPHFTFQRSPLPRSCSSFSQSNPN